MKIPCSIIKELLPNYIDGCIDEEASKYVEEHLKECEKCNVIYNDMKNPIDSMQDIEIDYLKKIRYKNYRRIIMVILIASCLCIAGISVAKTYFMGEQLASQGTVTLDELEVKNDKIVLLVHLEESDAKIRKINIHQDEEGMQTISYRIIKAEGELGGVMKEFRIDLKDVENRITIGNNIIDKAGNIYEEKAVQLVDHRTANMGDNTAVSNLIELSGIASYDFKIKLHNNEPFEIDIITEKTLSDYQYSIIEIYAKAVLASIDNCNIMNIIYNNGKENVAIKRVENTEKITTYEQMESLLNGN